MQPGEEPEISPYLMCFLGGAGTPFSVGVTDVNGKFTGIFKGSYARPYIVDHNEYCTIYAGVAYNGDTSTSLGNVDIWFSPKETQKPPELPRPEFPLPMGNLTE